MPIPLITHAGKAHFDDFLAVSLILATHEAPFEIERRTPTLQELENQDVWVVDVGERYQPELKNFDHHQNIEVPASFMLVSDYLNLSQTLSVMPWWEYKDNIDRFGPEKVAKEMGISSLLPAYSPVESWILKVFGDEPRKVADTMRAFGKYVIREAEDLIEKFAFWKGCEIVKIKDKVIIIGQTEKTTGSQRFSKQMTEPASISITYDGRGKGWRLARIYDAPGVDFSRLEGHKDILFAHKTGFIAKTKTRIPLKDVLALVASAIVSA